MKHAPFQQPHALYPPFAHADAVCLTVPGLGGSGPEHWQTRWEGGAHVMRVNLGLWNSPDPDIWCLRLDEAVRCQSRSIVLAAHSLGCHAVARWAASARAETLAKVRGALLVAPPYLEGAHAETRLTPFMPAPELALPFRSILVSSRSDHYATPDQSRSMAKLWGAEHIRLGDVGHINAESGLGDWPEGLDLVASLSAPNWAERSRNRIGRVARTWKGAADNLDLWRTLSRRAG